MKSIDRAKPILVTGANGYVASWLVKKLLDEGLTVHAAGRNIENEEKFNHLKEMAKGTGGSIVFFESDLLKPESYQKAMEGCELVYHTASPFTSTQKRPKRTNRSGCKRTENIKFCQCDRICEESRYYQ